MSQPSSQSQMPWLFAAPDESYDNLDCELEFDLVFDELGEPPEHPLQSLKLSNHRLSVRVHANNNRSGYLEQNHPFRCTTSALSDANVGFVRGKASVKPGSSNDFEGLPEVKDPEGLPGEPPHPGSGSDAVDKDETSSVDMRKRWEEEEQRMERLWWEEMELEGKLKAICWSFLSPDKDDPLSHSVQAQLLHEHETDGNIGEATESDDNNESADAAKARLSASCLSFAGRLKVKNSETLDIQGIRKRTTPYYANCSVNTYDGVAWKTSFEILVFPDCFQGDISIQDHSKPTIFGGKGYGRGPGDGDPSKVTHFLVPVSSTPTQ